MITYSGTIERKEPSCPIVRPNVALHVGSRCNDGRPITESAKYKEAVRLGVPIVKEKRIVVRSKTVANANANATGNATATLFVEKYKPASSKQIIGHKKEIEQIRTWLQQYDMANEKDKKKGLLVTGPPGIGKTTTVHLLVKEAGYLVTEYNASDVRSVSALKGIFALGMKRLQKEVIVMDEVDGAHGSKERGGIGELADIIRTSNVPIICIGNEHGPKLKPLLSVCEDIRFNRPVKSTIAATLLHVAKAEGLSVTKEELEGLCERNGNDIRSILNQLEFFEGSTEKGCADKDAVHRADPFSATGRLLGNRRLGLEEAANLVFVDYFMVPMMVQEAYVEANKMGSFEDTARAAEFLSDGDLFQKKLWGSQDWSLLPHVVQTTVAAARTVKGPAPWQIFPKMLGKNSTKAKKMRLLGSTAKKVGCSSSSMRLDYTEPMVQRIHSSLHSSDIGGAIQCLDTYRLDKDDLTEVMEEVLLGERKVVATKVKTAFTNQWKKTHKTAVTGSKRKSIADEEELEEELEELEEEMAELELD